MSNLQRRITAVLYASLLLLISILIDIYSQFSNVLFSLCRKLQVGMFYNKWVLHMNWLAS